MTDIYHIKLVERENQCISDVGQDYGGYGWNRFSTKSVLWNFEAVDAADAAVRKERARGRCRMQAALLL